MSELKQIVTGAAFSIPWRCRVGWHRWTQWGEAVSLRARHWIPIRGEYDDKESVVHIQARRCSDCNAIGQREAK